jgi:DNA repair protein RecO (recombination protein O)
MLEAATGGQFGDPIEKEIAVPGYYKTEAVVLRSMRLRESDRIVHLYTGARGRVGAVVKGVRRVRSRFGGRLEPYFRVRLVLYEGKGDLDTVTQAEAVEWYPRLRTRHASLHAAGAACESVLRLFSEGEANAPAYNLLCHELQLLDSDPSSAGPANMLAFRLKLLLAAGFVPELAECSQCGAPVATGRSTQDSNGGSGDGSFFSAASGGVLCGDCVTGDGFGLDASALSFMVRALAVPLKEAPAGSAATLAQVERVVAGTLEYHAHVRLRSAA